MNWLKGLSLNERLFVMTELADDPILPDVFTALSTSDLTAIDWFSETYTARSLLALSTSVPHARASMLEGFASALTTARAAKSPDEVAARVAEVLPYVQLSDGDVHTRIVTQGLDALSEVRREAAMTGDIQLVGEGVLAAHAPPRERAAIIEHASGFKVKPETLAPWEPDNLRTLPLLWLTDDCDFGAQ